MFNSYNSLPMNIRPRSDLNRLKAIQNELNKNKPQEFSVSYPSTLQQSQFHQNNTVNRIFSNSQKLDKTAKSETLNKVVLDPNPTQIAPDPKEKPSNNDKLEALFDQKFKQYMENMNTEDKPKKSEENKEKSNKNYEELKTFVESKLSVIDDLANYIRNQKNADLSKN